MLQQNTERFSTCKYYQLATYVAYNYNHIKTNTGIHDVIHQIANVQYIFV